MSQAPGLSGTPDSGHRSSAATSASWASSSASPTSRTIRASPAISLADSILQTASIARWASDTVTATDCGTYVRRCSRGAPRLPRRRLTSEVFRTADLTNLDLALPARPVLLVQVHEPNRRFDGLFLRLQLMHRVAADDLLGLGKGPIDHGDVPAGKSNAGAHRGRGEPP